MNDACNVLQVGAVGQLTGSAGVLHVCLDACKPSFPTREGRARDVDTLLILTLTGSCPQPAWAPSARGWDVLSGTAVEGYPV